MTISIRPALLCLSLAALLIFPGRAAAQIQGERKPPPVRVEFEVGLAALDERHVINAAPLFLTPGVQVRTTGRVFAFAGARALVFAFPVPMDGDDDVQDENGRTGFRDTGGLGGGPWLRAGVGAALRSDPRAPTVHLAGGSLGVGRNAHPWVGVMAGTPLLRTRWRIEAELGYDRNWVEDRFLEPDPADPFGPHRVAEIRRSDEWFRTMQIGVRRVR